MANKNSLRNVAQNFESREFAGIETLERIVIDDITLYEKEFNKEDGSTFSNEMFLLDDVEYRMPKSVIAGIQAVLKVEPDTQAFRVVKSGVGMNTKYTVVPVQ